MFSLKAERYSHSSTVGECQRQNEENTCVEAGSIISERTNPTFELWSMQRSCSAGRKSVRRPRKGKTTMGVCWMLMILLSCTSSHASLHQSPRGSEDTLRVCSLTQQPDLEIRCQNAQSHQPVFVPCPNVSIVDGKFQLFKNQTILCQLGTDNQMNCNQTEIKVQPCKSESNQIVGFNLTGPEIARDQAIYRCNAIIHFPPPYALKQSNERILIFTEDHRSCNKENSKEPVKESQGLLWVWIAAVSLLSTYGLAVTIVASINWFKMKEAENQNDYMNTKPKAPRKKKKKGLQTPIPRHF